jgi:membrane-bound lytic murein transglycosylase B
LKDDKWRSVLATVRSRRVSAVLCVPILLGLLVSLVATPSFAQSGLDLDTEIKPFAAQVAKEHGVDEARVLEVVAGARILPKVLKAMSRPAEDKQWHEYRPIFLTEKRIAQGVVFWNKHATLLESAKSRFGVSEEVIVAIIGVETFYGRRAGNIRVLDALATLGFRFPRRAAFFRRELGHYMVLSQTESLDVTRVNGSYAGAMGIPQFIPSSYREYAVDFDGDGRRDLIDSVADSIGSVAAYFSRHGWIDTDPVAVRAKVNGEVPPALQGKGLKPYSTVGEFAAAGVSSEVRIDSQRRAALIRLDGRKGTEHWLGFNNFYVITRYNRSPLYAMAAYQLAQAIAERRRSGG